MLECAFCERRCLIDEGESGYCLMYTNREGRLEPVYANHVSLIMVSRIESLPVFHFCPGSRTLVFATVGCNFDCHYCSNAYLARSGLDGIYMMEAEPEIVVRRARQAGCHNIAFAMNEPTVSLEYYIAVAEEARKRGFATGCLTNGYQTPRAAERLVEASDFINVSVKGFSDEFYRDHMDTESVAPVLHNVEYFHGRTHLEVTTPIIAALNEDHIEPIAEWLGDIDPAIPWHVYRLLPEYKMSDMDYPDIRQLAERLRGAKKHLDHIYFGNFAGSEWLSTHCPSCGFETIERVGLGGCGVKPVSFNVEDGDCPRCGRPQLITGECVDWYSAEIVEVP